MCVTGLGREWLKLYYYWADTDQANSAPRPSWDSRVYRLLDVLAPRHTFTADSHSAHVHINHVTRSLPVNAAGQIRHSTVSLLTLKPIMFCAVVQPSSIRRLATPWTYCLHLSLSSVILTDSSTGSPVPVSYTHLTLPTTPYV